MNKTMPDLDRVLRNLDRSGECWTWKLATESSGYARTMIGAGKSVRRVSVHRFIYESLVGPIPEGLQIDHLCRNPGCANPAHLEPVTAAENLARRRPFIHYNASRTHCKRGHDLADAYRTNRDTRLCRGCARLRERAYAEGRTIRGGSEPSSTN